MRTPLRDSGVKPRADRDWQTLRQEMPMSIRRWVSPRERIAALPEEPLARVRMVVIDTSLYRTCGPSGRLRLFLLDSPGFRSQGAWQQSRRLRRSAKMRAQ
jgi:hypothetical protein